MSEELKQCPFCGGTRSISVLNFFTRDSSRKCDICGAEAPEAKTPEEAAKKWNTRPAEDALKAKVESLKAENDELRYIVEQFSKWTAEGGCVKANFPDFPCWWERNRIELELDDYCDSEDEIEHQCWVEYYRWKFRQKNNNHDAGKGGTVFETITASPEVLADGTPMVRKFDNQENYRKERCTGQTDMEGRLIYENDIVNVYRPMMDAYEKGVVIWADAESCWVCKWLKPTEVKKDCWHSSDSGTYFQGSRCRVIGNIHEERWKNGK